MVRVLGYIVLALMAVFGGLAVYTVWYTGYLEGKYPPEGTYVNARGADLHYVERFPDPNNAKPGAPAIVLIHGASANLNDQLAAIANPLAIRGHRVILFDRPGHGFSGRGPEDADKPAVQAAMIREALDELGIEKPVILGHSWGGAVAAAFAADHGDAASAVVVLSGATHPWGGTTTWYNTLAAAPVIGPLVRYTAISVVGPMLLPDAVKSNFAPNEPVADYVERAAIPLLFRPDTFLANALDSIGLSDDLARQAERYPSITVPLLIITGDADRTVSKRIHSDALHRDVPSSELLVLEGVGHMPHHVEPGRVVDAIIRLADSSRDG